MNLKLGPWKNTFYEAKLLTLKTKGKKNTEVTALKKKKLASNF